MVVPKPIYFSPSIPDNLTKKKKKIAFPNEITTLSRTPGYGAEQLLLLQQGAGCRAACGCKQRIILPGGAVPGGKQEERWS